MGEIGEINILMPAPEITKLPAFVCRRCGHRWVPMRVNTKGNPMPPRVCPKCKSLYWRVKPGVLKRGRPRKVKLR